MIPLQSSSLRVVKGSVTLLTVLFVPTSLISSSVTKTALETEKGNNCLAEMIQCMHCCWKYVIVWTIPMTKMRLKD